MIEYTAECIAHRDIAGCETRFKYIFRPPEGVKQEVKTAFITLTDFDRNRLGDGLNDEFAQKVRGVAAQVNYDPDALLKLTAVRMFAFRMGSVGSTCGRPKESDVQEPFTRDEIEKATRELEEALR